LSRVKIAREKNELRLPDKEPIQLTDVAVTLFEGGPVSPLEFEISKLDWVLADESFSSKEHVTIRGKGLEAEGWA
jgi:hypothetical protein